MVYTLWVGGVQDGRDRVSNVCHSGAASGQARTAYRRKCSKRRVRPPPLLALLCVSRYEDGTFREAEVRLAEHSELRVALGLQHVPD